MNATFCKNWYSMHSGITLCGCGWLGTYLASAQLTHRPVTGSTRTESKAQALQSKGIQPVLYTLGDSPFAITEKSHGNIVILNIPLGRKRSVTDDFVASMQELIDAFMQIHTRHLIFISTTSVYGDHFNGDITEHSATLPETPSAKAHVAIEQHLRGYPDDRFSIVRLAGLVGPDRHPIRFLAGKSLSEGERRVNLVHVDDVVAALGVLIEQGGFGQVLHLCSEQHPSRGEYYTRSAQRLGLDAPQFNDFHGLPLTGKRIDASHSWQSLGLKPRFASPYDMLDNLRL